MAAALQVRVATAAVAYTHLASLEVTAAEAAVAEAQMAAVAQLMTAEALL